MFQTELEADRFERTIRHQLDGCTYRDPGQDRVRFGEWAERWWHTVEASTKVQYETILRRHVLPAITTGGSELFTPGLGDRRSFASSASISKSGSPPSRSRSGRIHHPDGADHRRNGAPICDEERQ